MISTLPNEWQNPFRSIEVKNDWNIKGGLSADLTHVDYATAYRAQNYKTGYSESNAYSVGAYDFHNFTSDIDRRFMPLGHKETGYYMGFDPLAVFVENNDDFRDVSINQPRPLPFSEAELSTVEIISFTGFGSLNLFDLNTTLALNRHNLRPDAAELVSVDYGPSSVFAKEVYEEGYDGMLFRTRQGILNAAVIWGRAKDKILCAKIKERKSALTVIRSIDNAERLLGIEIDTTVD